MDRRWNEPNVVLAEHTLGYGFDNLGDRVRCNKAFHREEIHFSSLSREQVALAAKFARERWHSKKVLGPIGRWFRNVFLAVIGCLPDLPHWKEEINGNDDLLELCRNARSSD
jgi:hypothetical protein